MFSLYTVSNTYTYTPKVLLFVYAFFGHVFLRTVHLHHFMATKNSGSIHTVHAYLMKVDIEEVFIGNFTAVTASADKWQ